MLGATHSKQEFRREETSAKLEQKIYLPLRTWGTRTILILPLTESRNRKILHVRFSANFEPLWVWGRAGTEGGGV